MHSRSCEKRNKSMSIQVEVQQAWEWPLPLEMPYVMLSASAGPRDPFCLSKVILDSIPPFICLFIYFWCSNSFWGSLPCDSTGKESACNVGNLGSIPALGRSLGEGKGYSLQYSGLEDSMYCIGHSPWGHKDSDTTERLSLHSQQFLI